MVSADLGNLSHYPLLLLATSTLTLPTVRDANYITEEERRSYSMLADKMPLRLSTMLDTAMRPARSSRAYRSAH